MATTGPTPNNSLKSSKTLRLQRSHLATELDFDIGSVWLALAEATAGNADWLQKLYLFALSVTRLATSNGAWVDTFCADYMRDVPGTTSPRLPSTYSTGIVVFSCATPQSQAVVPVGTLVATFDGSQTFQIYADSTNPAYSATIIPGGGFILVAGVERQRWSTGA